MHLEVFILLWVHELISVEHHVRKKLHVAHLMLLPMDFELDGIREGLIDMPFFQTEGGEHLYG